jgi:hypothetical protein
MTAQHSTAQGNIAEILIFDAFITRAHGYHHLLTSVIVQ